VKKTSSHTRLEEGKRKVRNDELSNLGRRRHSVSKLLGRSLVGSNNAEMGEGRGLGRTGGERSRSAGGQEMFVMKKQKLGEKGTGRIEEESLLHLIG